MAEIGHCSKCGRPCPYCRPRDGFSLTALDESVRQLVREVLDQTGASQAQQDRLVTAIMGIDPKHIKRARRIWDSQGLARQGKNYAYFKAIVQRCAEEASKDRTLDGLPPFVYPEEAE